MAGKYDLEVVNFMNKVTKGIEPDKVILSNVDITGGKYPAFATLQQVEADMRQKGMNIRYVYSRSACLQRALFIIDGDVYQLTMVAKMKKSNELTLCTIAVEKNGEPIARADSPFGELKPAAVCRYLTRNFKLDEDLHERLNPTLYFNLTMYEFDIGLKKLPKFDISEDKADEKTVESFQEILNSESMVAFYENNDFKYAKIRVVVEMPEKDEDGENPYVFKIAKVWLEDKEDGSKVLKSDMDLYDKDIYKTVRYNELASLLLKLQQTTIDITVVGEEEKAPKAIAVKGFGK